MFVGSGFAGETFTDLFFVGFGFAGEELKFGLKEL